VDKGDLRSLVLDVLRKTPQTHFRAIENDVRRLSEAYEKRDVLLLNEVLWEMLLQGLLAPGKNSLNPDLPFVHVTVYGAQCLDGGAVVAHDPDRYVERLIEQTGVEEGSPLVGAVETALRSFLDHRFPAALILLARAAEQALHDLVDALIRRGRRDGHGIKRLQASTQDAMKLGPTARRSLAGYNLPDGLAEDVLGHIDGLTALIEATRTRRRRPRIPSADRDGTLARFLLFLDQCRVAYDAIRWLEGESSG